MANHQYLVRGKTLEYRGLIKYVNGTNESDFDSSWTVDSTGLHHLSIQIHWSHSVTFSSGSFILYATNLDDFDGQVPIAPSAHAGSGTLSGETLTLGTGGAGTTILTYKDLPRWLHPSLSLGGSGSMVGLLSVDIYGWIV